MSTTPKTRKSEEAHTMELVRNKEKTAEYRRRAQELVAQMTLEEKIMQTIYQIGRASCRERV